MFRGTIKAQLIFLALTPLLLTILLVSAFFLNEAIDDIDNKLIKRGNDLSSQAALMSEFAFYTGDIDELKTVAHVMMNLDGVQLIRFTDSIGHVLVEQQHANQNTYLRLVSVPVYTRNTPLNDFSSDNSSTINSEKLGTIDIGLSQDSATAQRFYVYYRGLFIAFLSLIVGTIFILIFSRKLHTALTSLMETASEIQSGHLDKRCQQNGTGELLQFQQTFNAMAQALQHNEHLLQDKINAATHSLNATVDELSRKNKELDKTRQAAIELERSKAISDERTRIMRDMHDGVGGQLVASLALIEQEPDSVIKNNISTILSECLEDFRVIINSLNIHSDTLAILLADFKYRMNKKLSNLELKLHWSVDDFAESVTIQPQQSLHILRILQETFTNILKHAKATQIQFNLTETDGMAVMTIEDNGQFSTTTDSFTGHGITNMKWRATELKGQLSVSASPTGGCRVLLTFPIASSL